MNTNIVIKWSLLVITVGIVLSTCVKDWPYYKVSVPSGYTTKHNMFMGGTSRETAHLPVVQGVELTATAICYPRESDNFQPCHLIIRLDNHSSNEINFTEGKVFVRDPYIHSIDFAGRATIKKFDVTLLIRVDLKYKTTPREFELLLPDIAINDDVQVIPAIKFQYEDSFPYQYQFIPWFANY